MFVFCPLGTRKAGETPALPGAVPGCGYGDRGPAFEVETRTKNSDNAAVYQLSSVLILILMMAQTMPRNANAAPVQRVEETAFGKMPDGTVVRLFTLRNTHGMTAKV